MRFLQCASDKTETTMETTTTRSMHPLTAIAAVSVTLFSLAGIGAITGLIPTSHSQPAQIQAAKPAEEPSKLVLTAQPLEATSATTTTLSVPKPAAHKTAARRVKPVEHAARPAEEPVKTVKDEAPVRVAQNDPSPRYEPAPRAEPAKRACYDCGVIESVREIEKKGEGSGLGAVAGGVAGGVLGHQTGGGRGRDVMTVLGAVGGAFAGHQVEKNVKKVKSYEIAIRFNDGSSQLITQDNPPAWRSGDKVKLVNGVITAYN
jgi:outer membrane lipoprotein SlyB